MCSVQPLCCDFTERGVPEELLSRFKDYNGMTLSLGSETEGLFHRIPSQPAHSAPLPMHRNLIPMERELRAGGSSQQRGSSQARGEFGRAGIREQMGSRQA